MCVHQNDPESNPARGLRECKTAILAAKVAASRRMKKKLTNSGILAAYSLITTPTYPRCLENMLSLAFLTGVFKLDR